ncbi:zinc-ribbon domain-containing protein [Butyrivibrio sp. XPD2006]|uniref:zinc-ribbon domain-containing protein n=1 Tax=Butyrivibrio sp. XPD2006 TaxID=1280668 RepID=UPI0003B344C4|nr:zinc-ribbon domain-containing protein [Butyrivibrio sp. XPD2006]
MKICANCGTQVPDDAVFCNNCGSALTESAPAPTAGPEASQQAPTPVPAPAPAPGVQPQQGFQPQPGFQPQQGFQPQPGMQPQPGFQQYQKFDPSDHTADFDAKDIADNKLFAALPYFFSCLAGILAGLYVRDSEFIKFHTKVNIQYDIISVIILLFFAIPIVGWIVGAVLLLIVLVCRVISIIYVLQGKAKDAPIIGSIGFLKFGK